MEVKVIMRSVLECHLKPDLELVFSALNSLYENHLIVDDVYFCNTMDYAKLAEQKIKDEQWLAGLIKSAQGDERKALIAQKKEVSRLADEALENALKELMKAGGKDYYNYDYNTHFNRVVAGLMGSTCYMKEDFEALRQKGIRNILSIASLVENNGHHSTFGHSHLTLEITGINKAFAMVLNNEKEYCTSEKSARYTIMQDIEPSQNLLYQKWKDLFIKEIAQKYGKTSPFFDAKGVRVEKLAQENARYIISDFTPTNMVYTTSFRQLNYLAHWLENAIANPNANIFYERLKPQMQQFVNYLKTEGLYSETLQDNKGRGLTLFGRGLTQDVLTSEVYAIQYNATSAYLGQLQRHRSLDVHIDEDEFASQPKKFYIPQIIKDNKNLIVEWFKDIQSVAQADIPQGQLLPIVERGTTDALLMKALERVCMLAQKEIRDITREQCERIYPIIANSANQASQQGKQNTAKKLQEMANTFKILSKSARCCSGVFSCPDPCHNPHLANLNSDV